MMLKEEVFAQAALLAGNLDEAQTELLKVLCGAAVTVLTARLKDGLTPEDCQADFIAAASLYALANLGGADQNASVQEFRAGDLTVKQGASAADTASRCLQRQADKIIQPYLKDSFAFMGV